MKRTALVTGAEGFIGSHMVKFLASEGWNVIGGYRLHSSNSFPKMKNVKFVQCDLTNGQSVERLFQKYEPTHVFHLGAQSLPTVSWADPVGTFESNIMGSLHLFEAIRHQKRRPIVVSVNPATGIKTLGDFIAYAKKSDKPLTYSSSGLGSSGHLFAETFAQKAGIKVEHVPYKGAAQGLMDLVGGHITFSAQTVASSAALIRGGSLTAVALTAGERLPDFPDVPTFKELGYPDVVHTTWFSLSGPAALPPEIVTKVNGEIVKTMARPDVQQRLRQEGLVTEALTPAEFRKLIEAETIRWRPALERAGLIEK